LKTPVVAMTLNPCLSYSSQDDALQVFVEARFENKICNSVYVFIRNHAFNMSESMEKKATHGSQV
jgi:hypothetical protein